MATVNRLKKKKQNDLPKDINYDTPQNAPQGRIFKPTGHVQHTQQKQSQYQQYYELSQCNPIGVTPSSTLFPNGEALSRHYNFPLGISFSPMISLQNQNCEFMEKSGDKIQRCGGCRAYMNCYNTVQKKKFTCFLCGRQNMLEHRPNEEQQQIQMNSSIFQCLSPQNFYSTPADEDCFIFLVDLSQDSYHCKMLYYFVAAMKEVLARPELDQTYIYFYSYDQIIQEYDFSGEEIKCTIMDKTIAKSGNVQPNFLKDIRDKIFTLLDSLEQIAQHNQRRGSNLADAFQFVFPIAMKHKAKIFLLQSNEAIIGEPTFQEAVPKNKEQPTTGPKSLLQAKNNQLMDKYIMKMLQNGVSVSLFCFARNFKNLKTWGDMLKLSSSEIFYYTKDSAPDLEKFYYDLTYMLGATYFKQVKTEFIISHGYSFHAVYGNFYRIKESICFLNNYLESSRKIFCLFSPSQKAQNYLPYLSLQINVNYRYQREDYMTVFTLVYPVTGFIDRLITSMDLQTTQTLLHKSYLSSLRMQKIPDVRKKVYDAGVGIWVTLLEIYKKKQNIPPEYMAIFSSILAMLKSYHIQLEATNNTPMFDKIVSQRNLFQFSGVTELTTYFSPYLFDLMNMDDTMCREDVDFVYPPSIQAKFANVKQGIFLLDNGIALYLFIAKKCPPEILAEVFGKSKITKNEPLGEQNIVETETFRSSQIQVLVKTLREQRASGWAPLYVVRCGQVSNNQRNFYLNFYMERYEEFRNYKVSLDEFISTLSKNIQ